MRASAWIVAIVLLGSAPALAETDHSEGEEPTPSSPEVSSLDSFEMPARETELADEAAARDAADAIEEEQELQKRIDKARKRLKKTVRKERRRRPAETEGVERYNPEKKRRRRRSKEDDESGIDRYDSPDSLDASSFAHYRRWRQRYEQVEAMELRESDLRTRSQKRPFTLGFEAHFARGPGARRDEDNEALTAPGFWFAYNLARNFAIGVGQLSPATAKLTRGRRYGFTAAPFVEFSGFLGERFQLFGQAGAAVQWRAGGKLRGDMGTAPYLGGGLRGWFSPSWSVGPSLRLLYVATDGFMVSPVVLPQGTLVIAGGASLEVHL